MGELACASVFQFVCVMERGMRGAGGGRKEEGEGVSPAGRINKPIQLNVAPALPNVPALLQQCRRQQHPLLISWSVASEAGRSLVEEGREMEVEMERGGRRERKKERGERFAVRETRCVEDMIY